MRARPFAHKFSTAFYDSQIAKDSRKIPTDLQSGERGDETSLYFPQKCCIFFPTFPSGVENTCCQFSRRLFNQFANCLRIKVLEFYKKVCGVN